MQWQFGALFVLVSLCACSTKDATSWSSASNRANTIAIGEQRTGEATYYDFANGDGACMFGPSPDDLNAVARGLQLLRGPEPLWVFSCDGPNHGNGRADLYELFAGGPGATSRSRTRAISIGFLGGVTDRVIKEPLFLDRLIA